MLREDCGLQRLGRRKRWKKMGFTRHWDFLEVAASGGDMGSLDARFAVAGSKGPDRAGVLHHRPVSAMRERELHHFAGHSGLGDCLHVLMFISWSDLRE